MKYCNKCKVNVNKRNDNCPLCGAWLDSHNDNDNYAAYRVMDETADKPTVTIYRKVNFLKTKFNKIMLFLMALCVALNLILTPSSLWAAYVIIGCIFVIFCIIMPVAEKTKIQAQIKADLAIITLLAFALELTVTKLHYQWFVLVNVLPWIYSAAVVLVDFLILFRRYEDKGLFMTLGYCTFFAVAPQIVIWICKAAKVFDGNPLNTFVIFFAALLNLAVVLIVCTRSLKEEIERNFNL